MTITTDLKPSARYLWPVIGLVLIVAGGAPAAAQQEAAQAASQRGSVEAGREKATTCAACHGEAGNSPSAEWPSLAGQHAEYTVDQLKAFRDGTRPDVLDMQNLAAQLSEQDMWDIAAYYEAQTLEPKGANPDLVSRGEDIYRGGIPERGIAACIACHGPSGRGNPMAAYPRISNQHATYVEKTLGDYASGERRSDADVNQMMRNVAEMLLEEEMRALASYVQGLR